jgi:radical SAM superfamily enzyme YgiQ (UPF0313 family)
MPAAQRSPVLAIVQQLSVEKIGPMTLAAVLRQAGYEARLVLGMAQRDVVAAVRATGATVVGFSTRTGQHSWCLRVADRVRRELGVPVLFGGPHATHCPEVIRHPAVDFVLRGEADGAIVPFVEMLAGRRAPSDVPSLVWKDGEQVRTNPLAPPPEDLDDLPAPDREFAYRHPYLRDNPLKTFIGGRGCPYSCSFCHNHLDRQLYAGFDLLRRCNPARFVSEIEEVARRYPLRTIDLENDDHFLLDLEWAGRVLESIASRLRRPYLIQTRVERLTAPVVRMLADTGCAGVSFGVESANPRLRNAVLGKGIRTEDVWRAVEALRRHRIPFKTYFMLGIPGETVRDAHDTLDMAVRMRPDAASCSIATPYPGTRLHRIAAEQGLLPDPLDDGSFEQLFLKSSLLRMPGIREMENLQKLFFVAARHPALVPLARQLARLPGNPLLTAFGLAAYTFYSARFERHTPVEIARLMLQNAAYGAQEILRGRPSGVIS